MGQRRALVTRSRFSGGTVPAGGSDEPNMATIGTLFFSDNMAGYSTATAMGSDCSGILKFMPNPAPCLNSAVKTSEVEVISPGRGGIGKSLRAISNGEGGNSMGTFLTHPENFGSVNPDNTTNYFQYWARMTSASPFFNSSTQLAVKWFEMWWKNGGGRIQTNTRYGGSGAGGYDFPGHSCGWEIFNDAVDPDQLSAQPVGPYPSDLFDDGLYHRFTYALKAHQSAGNKDGFCRMWIDGTKVLDRSAAAVGHRPAGATKDWCTPTEVDDIRTGNSVAGIRIGEAQTTSTPAWTKDVSDFLWRIAA